MSARGMLVALMVLCCWLAGCGVPLQDQSESFVLPSDETSRPGPPEGVLDATVFLADQTRLVPVERATSDTSPRAVLLLLVEGTTGAESAGGLRSALAPGSLDQETLERGPEVRGRIVEVSVTERFTSTAGDDQLLATAQLVWTVTEGSSARWVRAVLEGEPIELPTDTGLSDAPVSREDFESVAPTDG